MIGAVNRRVAIYRRVGNRLEFIERRLSLFQEHLPDSVSISVESETLEIESGFAELRSRVLADTLVHLHDFTDDEEAVVVGLLEEGYETRDMSLVISFCKEISRQRMEKHHD